MFAVAGAAWAAAMPVHAKIAAMHSCAMTNLVFMGHPRSQRITQLAHGLVKVTFIDQPSSMTIFLPSSLMRPLNGDTFP
jgi:hypothetical protein